MRDQVKSQTIAKQPRAAGRPHRGKPGASKPLSLRISAEDRGLLDHAAAALGKTRTEFMLEAARERAKTVLMDRMHIVLDPDSWRAFAAALDGPTPKPAPELRRLMKEKRPWD